MGKRDKVTDMSPTPAKAQPTHLQVPLAFANALAQYLGTKPAQETLGFLNGLGQLAREQGVVAQPPPPQDTTPNG